MRTLRFKVFWDSNGVFYLQIGYDLSKIDTRACCVMFDPESAYRFVDKIKLCESLAEIKQQLGDIQSLPEFSMYIHCFHEKYDLYVCYFSFFRQLLDFAYQLYSTDSLVEFCGIAISLCSQCIICNVQLINR